MFDMYIPCEASSWTLLHQNRKLSSRISLQNRLFCLCGLPAVNNGNLRITINHATNWQNHENVSNPYIYYTYRVMVFNATFNNISVSLRQSLLLVEETRENPEITIPKSKVWTSKCEVRTLKSEVWRYLSLSVSQLPSCIHIFVGGFFRICQSPFKWSDNGV